VIFVAVKLFEFRAEALAGWLPRTNTFFATYYTLTGVHVLHVIGAIAATVWILLAAKRASAATTTGRVRCLAVYWGLVEVVWLAILAAVYFT
jgi:heme/copper-type cytochrome/quinol oxidase subunit 3